MSKTLTGIERQTTAVVGIVIATLGWAALSFVLRNPVLLPSPLQVIQQLFSDLQNSLFWAGVGTTFGEAALGCVLGALISLPLGYAIYANRYLAAALSPLLAISQAVPSIAVAPLFVIWFGYGTFAISTLAALIVFFPILTTTVLGLKSINRQVLEAACLDGADGWRLLTQVEIPLALPALLAGLRTGFTLSVIGAVVGEFTMGGHGLGDRLMRQSATADTTGLFSTISVLCLGAALIFATFTMLERHSPTIQAIR